MRVASREYVGKSLNIDKLADSIEEYFQIQGYKTQSEKRPDGWIIQARKEGVLRGLLAADRAFTVTITGEPNNVKISIGIGRWLLNLGTAIIEGLALAPFVLLVEIPITLWSFEIENKFWQFVEKEVELQV
ncbi:MAG: hypothetical protein OK422_01910 [Thaumarchaeota archaeon]|nr:hypothetical protein [Nitrososphaerota archaeon]